VAAHESARRRSRDEPGLSRVASRRSKPAQTSGTARARYAKKIARSGKNLAGSDAMWRATAWNGICMSGTPYPQLVYPAPS